MTNYVLTVKLDPTQLNQQIQRIQAALGGGGGPGGGQNPQQSTAQKLLKFGLMAAGVATLVKLAMKITDLVVSSSPMLKQMLNLFNNELMLMLMPLGNFIGFVMQPILLVLLRNFILPFYRYFMPLAQRYGLQLGDGISRLIIPMLQFFIDPAGSLAGLANAIGKTITGGISGAGGALSAWINSIISDTTVKEAFDGIGKTFTNLYTEALNWANVLFPQIGKAFTVILNGIYNGLSPAWADIVKFFVAAQSAITGILKNEWITVTKFFSTLASDVSGVVSSAWVQVMKFFAQLMSDVSGDAITAWNNVIGFFKWIGTALGNAWNWFASAVSTLTMGLVKPPQFSNTSSPTQPTGGISTTQAKSITSINPSPNITVNVQAGSIVTSDDLKKAISTEVQKVWIKGLKGNR